MARLPSSGLTLPGCVVTTPGVSSALSRATTPKPIGRFLHLPGLEVCSGLSLACNGPVLANFTAARSTFPAYSRTLHRQPILPPVRRVESESDRPVAALYTGGSNVVLTLPLPSRLIAGEPSCVGLRDRRARRILNIRSPSSPRARFPLTPRPPLYWVATGSSFLDRRHFA
jgi:hypothetical protein